MRRGLSAGWVHTCRCAVWKGAYQPFLPCAEEVEPFHAEQSVTTQSGSGPPWKAGLQAELSFLDVQMGSCGVSYSLGIRQKA